MISGRGSEEEVTIFVEIPPICGVLDIRRVVETGSVSKLLGSGVWLVVTDVVSLYWMY